MAVIESKYPVLVLSFRNCELHCCHLDGYKKDGAALAARLAQVEASFGKNARCRVWYNVDDTVLSGEAMQLITQSIARLQGNIVRLALIGTGHKKRRFQRALAGALSAPGFPVGYFSDAELAKEWLV